MNLEVIVIGAESQLGKTLRVLRPSWQYLSRSDLDLVQINEIKNILRKKPKVLINFAAFTGVDLAESKKDEAMLINATAVGELAKYCEHFIHISTDYVFSGDQSRPYTETDPTLPVNYYGFTKLQGEQLAFKNNKNSYVFRTSWLYSEHNINFVKRILELGRQREKSGDRLKMVNDQIGTPTCAADLVQTIVAVIDNINNFCTFKPGIYHFSNEGECTWYEFAQKILQLKEVSVQVVPISTSEYPTPAKRPPYSVLDKTKIKTALGIDIPHWRDSLTTFLKVHL